MEISQRTELILKLICILILISLCLAIYLNGKDLSCSKCQVKIQKDNNIFNVNITTLYENYKLDNCNLNYVK
jgi:hypothetical protein